MKQNKDLERLKEFFKIVGLSGARTIKEVVINFTETDIKICSHSLDNSVRLRANFKSNPLGIVSNIGLIEFDKVLKYLNIIEIPMIEIEANRFIILGGKKKGSFLTQEPDFINTKLDIEKMDRYLGILEGGITVEIDIKKLQTAKKYLIISKSEDFKIKVSKGLLKVIVGNKNSNIYEEEFDVDYTGKETVTMNLKLPFVDSMENLNGIIKLTMKKDAPIGIFLENDFMKVEILVAQSF